MNLHPYAHHAKTLHCDLRPRLDARPRARAAARALRAYAKHRTFTIAYEFIDHLSGATTDRPELAQLWQATRGRKIDTVLVWKFDRFARSTKQLIDALEEFQHLGVDFISITEQIDTGSPMGKAMFTIISAIAEFERSLI